MPSNRETCIRRKVDTAHFVLKMSGIYHLKDDADATAIAEGLRSRLPGSDLEVETPMEGSDGPYILRSANHLAPMDNNRTGH